MVIPPSLRVVVEIQRDDIYKALNTKYSHISIHLSFLIHDKLIYFHRVGQKGKKSSVQEDSLGAVGQNFYYCP